MIIMRLSKRKLTRFHTEAQEFWRLKTRLDEPQPAMKEDSRGTHWPACISDEECLVGAAVRGCSVDGCNAGVGTLPPSGLQQAMSGSVLEQSHVLFPRLLSSPEAFLANQRRRDEACLPPACREKKRCFSRDKQIVFQSGLTDFCRSAGETICLT